MVGNGAKHLLLPSRSGVTSREQRDFVRAMETVGIATYTPLCDVSDFCILQDLLADWNLSHPPIKGCIQASMVLTVSHSPSSQIEQLLIYW